MGSVNRHQLHSHVLPYLAMIAAMAAAILA